MTVRSKLLLVTAATLVALVSLICVMSILVLVADFNAHEENHIRHDLATVVSALNNELSRFEDAANDFASREEVCSFMEGNSAASVNEVFSNSVLAEHDLGFVALISPAGDLTYGKGFDSAEGVETPFPAVLKTALNANGALVRRAGAAGPAGLAVFDGQAYMVSSRPIAANPLKGPVKGTIVLGRTFDDDEVAELSALTLTSIRTNRVGDPLLPDDFKHALSKMSGNEFTAVTPLSEDVMAGYQLLRDIEGKPAVVMRMDMPRDYRRQFLAGLRYFLLASVMAALALGGANLLITERTVLGRLTRLKRFVRGIRGGGNLASRVDVRGADELAELAAAVNNMLGALERDADALSREKNLLRTLIDMIPDPIYVKDLDGRKTLVNVADATAMGMASPDEAVGKTDFDAYPPELAARFQADDRTVIETGQPLLNREESYSDGSSEWYGLTTKIPLRDADGKVVGLIGIGRDITGRRKTEQTLAMERNLLQTVIDALPDLVYAKDLEGRKLLTNPAEMKALGAGSREEVIGKTDFDFYPHDLAADWRVHDERIMQSGQPFVGTGQPFRMPDASYKFLQAIKVPLKDADGKVVGLVGVARDLTELKNAMDALGESEKKYRQLVELAQEGIWALDENANIIFVNPKVAQMLGYAVEEITGRSIYSFLTPEGAQAQRERVLRRRQGLTDTFESELVRKDGSHITVSVAASPVLAPDGAYRGSIGVATDVTERKRAEEILRESEQRYRSLFTSMINPCALCEIVYGSTGSACDYRFLDVNPAWESWIGRTRQEVIGKTFSEIHGKIDRSWLEMYTRVAETGEGFHFERFSPALGKHLEATAFSPKKGQFAAISADVTERRKTQEEVARLRRQIDFVLSTTKTGLDIVDDKFNVRYVDDEWRKTYGDPMGRKCYEYFRGETGPCSACSVEEALRTGKPAVAEYTLPKENGRPVMTTSVPYQDDAGEWLVAEISVDISDRRRLEEQLLQSQKMEAIGQLAGGVAHDFNNLLTGILGYANMLKLESTPGTAVHDAAGTIERAAERAAELTRQLLGFARRGKYLRVPVDVNSIAREVILLLGRAIDKNIAVTERFAANPPAVMGDPDQIQQAILNLAVNARDAMPDGGELTIETQAVDIDDEYSGRVHGAPPGRYLKISVIDTGVGIPAEVRQRIFEPFFTTKEQGKGTGMGLAMVYGIVKNHNGFVRLYTEVGHGARFDVYLPASEETGAPAAAEKTAPVAGTGRILLVDDEDIVRSASSEMLRSLGYQVTAVTSGKEAVEYYRQHHAEIDLAIIDLVMPGMGARECFGALKEINPSLRALLSSGYGLNGKAQETVDDGMCGFVQKPYTMADLSHAVRNAMAGS